MSLVDIVKHALPMKLADGKRHVWPTLASMVYLKDGTTPLADEDGKITVDNSNQLNGKDASEYLLKNEKTYEVTVNSEAVGSALITAKSVGNVLFFSGYFELVSGYAGNGLSLRFATASGVRLASIMYSTIVDRQNGNAFQVTLANVDNVVVFDLAGSNIAIDTGVWLNFGIVAQIEEA